MGDHEDDTRHQAAARKLFDLLGLPLGVATTLDWNTGKRRKIVAWVARPHLRQARERAPAEIDGYPVVVSVMPKCRPLAA